MGERIEFERDTEYPLRVNLDLKVSLSFSTLIL